MRGTTVLSASLYRSLQQTLFGGPSYRFCTRTTIKQCQQIPNVHLDRARAEDQLLGDLAIGQTLGHQLKDLVLAWRKLVGGLMRKLSFERIDALKRLGDLLEQRTRPKFTGGSLGILQQRQGPFGLARLDGSNARAQLVSGITEGHAHIAQQLKGLLKVAHSLLRMARQQGIFAQSVQKGREGLGLA